MTLEKGKSYGQEQIQQTLQDKARTRLNNPSPHQAPQRERVSRVSRGVPSSPRSGAAGSGGGSGSGGGAGGSTGRGGRPRRWKALIRPDVNLGVPTLMMILEPNIVWEHTKAYVPAVGKDVEANITPGEFFEGWHKGGRRAHGVYEGSYWELIGDCDEVSEMLRKMSRAPALLEEPPLELAPPPELPAWEDFKPNLHLIPAVPALPPLKLPPFRAPILEPEPPFVEPEYLPVPVVPPVPKEEPLPVFIPPEFLHVEAFQEPPYVDPEPPVVSEPPRAPTFGQPKHGHDWTGDRPFQLDLPTREAFIAEASAQRVMDTSRFVHPPQPMPPLPDLEPLDTDLLKGLDLDPIPKLELAWMGGPEPDPPYASVPSSPAALSRHSSRVLSQPPSRPVSAIPRPDGSGGGSTTPPEQPSPAPSSRPRSAKAGSSPGQTVDGGVQRRSGLGSRQASLNAAAVRTPEEAAWEEARSVASEASGTPRMWLNFATPFAELPPIMMPPRPEPGSEPQPEEFPHEALEDLPPFTAPPQIEVSPYVEPPQYVPAWAPPCEPRPVGFLRGTAPVLICDVSGTMNPRQQGRFRELKRCAVDLLDPEGEIATAAAGFDVITFAGSAWSWSAGYGERMGLLQSSQVPYSGRQVGGRYSAKTPPGAAGSRSGSPERAGGSFTAVSSPYRPHPSLALMPSSPDLLSDAQRWVANWPDAVGQTNLLAAFALAQQHVSADCWYVLSDGMAHDQQGCIEFLARRMEAGLPLPVIHAVGFIPPEASPDTSGERFLRGIAELTGGSYQRYTPDVNKVWFAGQGLVRADLRNERPEQREERLWAERQLRAERIKNLRLGIVEPLDITMERVAALHHQFRVLPAVRANEMAVAEARRRYDSAVESARVLNERRLAEATAAYDADVEDIRLRNQAKVDAAREAFLQAHGTWERDYLDRLQDWEDAKATLERQREEQLAASRAAAAASASPASPLHRPTSATRLATYARSKSGTLLSPRLEPSELRAAHASAEYGAVMGLDSLAEKLSSPLPTPPGSRPASALPYRSPSGAIGSGSGGSGGGGGSRPVSAKMSAGAVGLGDAGGAVASEYLEVIAEDLAEASAPIDQVYGSSGAAAVAAEGLDDDGLDVRPSAGGRGGSGGRGGRDQDGGSRPRVASARPLSSGDSGGVVGVSYRPLSARAGGAAGGSAGSRGGSARSTTSGMAATAAAASFAKRPPSASGIFSPADARISEVVPTAPPPLPEPSAPLEPLRGERSDDFKRRVLPPEVVAEHDAANSTRLGEIRDRWEALVAEDEEANAGRRLLALRRNAARVEAYRKAVYEAYADGLLKDIVFGGAVRVAANKAIMDSADDRYQAELLRVQQENERLRQVHLEEVRERRQQEEVHAQAYQRWQEGKETQMAQYEADRERAKAEHEANIVRLKAEWRAKKQHILELNDARLTEAEAAYNDLVERVKENNRLHKLEHTELLRQRKEVETINHARLAEAKTVHKVRLEARGMENERLVKAAMEEHQALCVRLGEEYEEAKVQAEADHSELCAFLRTANEQLTDEARRRYQGALAEVQAAYEADCSVTREAHAKDLDRVRRYNQEIWPRVAVARLAQAELARVQAFAEHIRFCANKYEMGINLLPNTPNYDRVVEMQALTEALARAFPDMSSNALPWPDHERRLEPGTGWVAAPPTRPCTYRDPADIINRIAKGKSVPSPSGGSFSGEAPPRGSRAHTPRAHSSSGGQNAAAAAAAAVAPVAAVTAAAAAAAAAATAAAADPDTAAAGVVTSSGSVDEHPYSPYQAQPFNSPRHASRPLSAGRARFAGVLSAESAAAAAGMRPMSAIAPGGAASAVAGRVEAWAAATLSALSSPGGGAGGITAAGGGAAGAAFLRPQSAAPGGGSGYHNPSAWRRSNNTAVLRAGSARSASNLGSAAAAAAAAAAAMGSGGGSSGPSRPHTARPGTAGGMSAASSSRPRSAGPAPRPARVAVDVQPLQASVARSKAQAGAHLLAGAALAGFAKDVPKLRYPEVDVAQPLTITGR